MSFSSDFQVSCCWSNDYYYITEFQRCGLKQLEALWGTVKHHEVVCNIMRHCTASRGTVQHCEAQRGKVRQIRGDAERSQEKMLSVVELGKWGFLEKMWLGQCCVNARSNHDIVEKGNKTGKKWSTFDGRQFQNKSKFAAEFHWKVREMAIKI